MQKQFPEWASMMLKLAGVTNAFWGLTFALFPDTLFRWAGMTAPQYLFPWQMIGVMAVIFGVFYFAAAFNPRRHIMIISMGFIAKVTQLIFVLDLWAQDVLPVKLVLYFLAKDFIWLGPMAIILYLAVKMEQAPKSTYLGLSLPDVLARVFTNNGENMKSITDDQPVLLIFLRHFGCISCHWALLEISNKRTAIEKNGVKIAIVHMTSYEDAAYYLSQYGLRDVTNISDPNCDLYAAFRLNRMTLRQMFRPKSLKLLVRPDTIRRQNFDKTAGDKYRMPGVFLVYKGELLKAYKHAYVYDQPDFLTLASIE